MIDQLTIDRINEAARIEDVVSDYVTLRKRGVNLLGLCPFHNEKTPSFTVSPAKGIFKCFGCGKGGNAIHFIMEHEQFSYVEALKYLAKKYNIEVVEKELTPEEKAEKNERESMLLVNDFAQKHFSDTLHHHVEGKSVGLSYFRERGFRDDIIRKFQLGYCLDATDYFTQTALKSGYKKEFLVKTGLTYEGENNYVADRFRGRVIFPVHTLSGKVVAFGGRILKKNDKLAKYVNSPESEIYHKSNELYGIFFAKQAIVKHDRCFLVEGYTDVISMHQSGIENVVASSGTALTPAQIRLIHRFTEHVTVIYDGDEAGIKASLRGIDLLLEEGLNIRVLLLPDGDDPDSFARKHNASDFIRFVEDNSHDFIQFKTDLLLKDAGNDPIKKANLIQDIVRSISIIPNKIIQTEYVKACSNLLDVREEVLYHEITKIKQKKFYEDQKESERNKLRQERESKQDESEPTQALSADSKLQFDSEEKHIVGFLLKYGTHVLYEAQEEEQTSTKVYEYFADELKIDNISFKNKVYQSIFDEYLELSDERKLQAENHFTMHSDVEMSRVAADLVTEKYTLSKIHSKFRELESDDKRLHELAPRYIYEYKLALIMQKRKSLLLDLKKASETQDSSKMMEVMERINLFDTLKAKLSKELDRVLNII